MPDLVRPIAGPLMQPKKRGRPRTRLTDDTLALHWTPSIEAFIWAVAHGEAAEVACFGTRGDGKTMGALGAMLEHARLHQAAGFPWPVQWIGVTDTFASHQDKTKKSLLDPMWTAPNGKHVWVLRESDHLAVGVIAGHEAVHLQLFGIENQSQYARVRTQCHGVWFEEPAPVAVMVNSSGIGLLAWSIALTSRRLASHSNPAMMTLNYPYDDHWTWQRFQPAEGPVCGWHPSDRTRLWFRIPPGERATASQRAEWMEALRDRPDLQQTLLLGKPGAVSLGPEVAQGFREDLHVAPERLMAVPGEPLFLGQDFGLTPTTIIGQVVKGERRILVALTTEKGGVRQHVENELLPWLRQHAPWTVRQPGTMLRGCYDVSGQTGDQSDIEQDPISVLERLVGGLWCPGPIDWPSRQHVLLSAMQHHCGPGRVSLRIDPIDARPLIAALSTRWYYPVDRNGQVRRDLPKKPNHPWEDLGDAFVYWLWGLTGEPSRPATVRVETAFDPARPGVSLGDAVPVVSTW